MSNFHAKISYHNSIPGQSTGGFLLTDVGSTNRTWLRLSAEGEQSSLHVLKVGDYLKIGSTVFQVESSDIHNLKNMPVINRRVQGQNYLDGGNVEMQPSESMPGEDNNTSEEDSNMMIDEEESKQDDYK